jgi:hypothetical protein
MRFGRYLPRKLFYSRSSEVLTCKLLLTHSKQYSSGKFSTNKIQGNLSENYIHEVQRYFPINFYLKTRQYLPEHYLLTKSGQYLPGDFLLTVSRHILCSPMLTQTFFTHNLQTAITQKLRITS